METLDLDDFEEIDEADHFGSEAFLQDQELEAALATTDRERLFQFTGSKSDMTAKEAVGCSHRVKFNTSRRMDDELDTALCLYELNTRNGWKRLKDFATGDYYKDFPDCAFKEFGFKKTYSYRLVIAGEVYGMICDYNSQFTTVNKFSTVVENPDSTTVENSSDGKQRIKINALKTIGDYDIKEYIPLYVKSCELAGERPPTSRHIKEAAHLLGFLTNKELNSDHTPAKAWTENLFVDEERGEVTVTAKTRYTPDSLFQIPNAIIKYSDFHKLGYAVIRIDSKKYLEAEIPAE